MISVHKEKLEACPAKEAIGGAEEAPPFRLAGQVAEVAEGNERIAALLDGTLDQVTQVASVAVHVARDEQTAHSSRGYRARSSSRAESATPGANGTTDRRTARGGTPTTRLNARLKAASDR